MILAFDTSAAHCAAALFSEGLVLDARCEPMAKGQAERILTLCKEILEAHDIEFSDLDAVGVGIGPGNFTGIRISVSAARGLALGLGVPAIPVSSFEILRDPNNLEGCAVELVSVEAPRGMAYAQTFRHGRPQTAPDVIDPTSPPAGLRRENQTVTGHRAQEIAQLLGAESAVFSVEQPAAEIARIAHWKLQNGHDIGARPAPLYVRAPDAAPARDTPPRILA